MSGAEPMRYQWFLTQAKRKTLPRVFGIVPIMFWTTNTDPVPDSDTNTLVMPSAIPGDFFVTVTNDFGSFISHTATVTVIPIPPRPNITLTLSVSEDASNVLYYYQSALSLDGPWQTLTNSTQTNVVFDWPKTDHGLDHQRFYRTYATNLPLTFCWEPEPEASYYKVYAWTEDDPQYQIYSAGTGTNFTVMPRRGTNYFAVTAWNFMDVGSDLSDRLTWVSKYDSNTIPCLTVINVQN
jgi:hypothetical protein